MKRSSWLISALIIFLFVSQTIAKTDFLYFSFKKTPNKVLIGVEGYLYYQGKKVDLEGLNYEWTLIFNDQVINQKTYSPFITLDKTEIDNLAGSVKIFPNDARFIKTQNFSGSFPKLKSSPSVAIVKYNPNLNIIFPFSRLQENEVLYALPYDFSSKNISYEWLVLNQKYTGQIFNPKNLPPGTIINLTAKNLDNPTEVALDVKILE